MSKIERTIPKPVAQLIKQYFKESGLSSAHNTHRVFEAWDEASGAAQYTVRKFYRDGVLYITINSSAARAHLQIQSRALIDRINEILHSDPCFIEDDSQAGYVKELRLK